MEWENKWVNKTFHKKKKSLRLNLAAIFCRFYITKEENIAFIVVVTWVSLQEIRAFFPFQSSDKKEPKQNWQYVQSKFMPQSQDDISAIFESFQF